MAQNTKPMRADKYLADFGIFSTRSQAKEALDAGQIIINEKRAKPSTLIFPNDAIEVMQPNPRLQSFPAVDFKIVFEDSDILVIDKPAGVLVHPTQGGHQNSLVEALKQQYPLSRGYSPDRPGIVHRLDRDTSGLLIVAKTDTAQDVLYDYFRQKQISRIYLAITYRNPPSDQGTISTYLIRHPTMRTKRVSLRDPRSKKILNPQTAFLLQDFIKQNNARLATTHYRVLARGKDEISLVELTLETGRTHQIRVHLSEMGAPILGDKLYSKPSWAAAIKEKTLRHIIEKFPRCALHAYRLHLTHPITKKALTFNAPLPSDMANLLSGVGIKYVE